MPKLNRRTILQMLGASAVGSMLPWTQSASAQAGPVPLRVLFVELGHGARRGTWEPTVAGPIDPMSTTAETSWSFQPVMAALEPFKSRINLFQNLDMVSSHYDPTGGANAHIGGSTHMLVADDRLTPELGGGVSIDQRIAQELNAGGLVTRLRSLEVGAKEDSGQYFDVFHHDSYATPGEKLPFLCHVPAIWDHIFPEPLSVNVQEQQRQIAKRTSVYDFVRGDYERLIARLGEGDRAKIEAMLDTRSVLQEGLTLINDREQNRPPESILDPWHTLTEGYQQGHSQNRLWSTHVDLISLMVAAALHTDTTRVATYTIDLPPDYEVGYANGTSYGGVTTSDWHDLMHKVSGDAPELTDPAARQVAFDLEKATYDKLAALLAHLDSLPETDGGTMLDHTLVVVYSHIAEGSHDLTRLPWMTIGNAQGALRTGRYVRFPITHMNNVNQIGQINYATDWSHRIYTYRGRPHNDLFHTVAHAMGVPLSSFGRAMAENKGLIGEIVV